MKFTISEKKGATEKSNIATIIEIGVSLFLLALLPTTMVCAAKIDINSKAHFVAPGVSEEYQSLIEEVEQAASEGRFSQGFLAATQLVAQLHADLKINEVVARVKTKMIKVVDEVVTEKKQSEWSYEEGLSLNLFIFGSANYNGKSSASSNTDVTKKIVRNQSEVVEFSGRVKDERQQLSNEIRSYVLSNVYKILLLKEAGQKAFELAVAAKSSGQAQMINPQSVNEIAQMVTQINFLGQQTITSCVKTNYADRFNDSTEDSAQSASGSLFFFSAGANSNSHKYSSWRQLAHSETSCQSSTNSFSMSPNDRGLLVNFTQVDMQLLAWKRMAIGVYYLSLNGDYVYPTFGNRFFK